jgi:peroxiredoxin
MSKIRINSQAPEFALRDFNGNLVHLSDFKTYKNVVLVFNRGFM